MKVFVCKCRECVEGMAQCIQCGADICVGAVLKRKVRGKHAHPDYCVSCNARPMKALGYKHPVLGEITCYPWQGEIDDEAYPVDEFGVRVKPGERICGHNDCTNSNHIRPFKVNAPLVMGGLEEQLTEKV
ncbi:hypothetical protein UFOVP219_23 [uncultured Caudovirales phage]|uniref:Uncharacterized protein n=1 Tax=uncultured Caudovirales phage TaxID=2100421 RepID=A0A6J7WKC2_9CAUD|nr:hypothetical protein UFOVP219_23 [uncultured Caudovirales phage]